MSRLLIYRVGRHRLFSLRGDRHSDNLPLGSARNKDYGLFTGTMVRRALSGKEADTVVIQTVGDDAKTGGPLDIRFDNDNKAGGCELSQLHSARQPQ